MEDEDQSGPCHMPHWPRLFGVKGEEQKHSADGPIGPAYATVNQSLVDLRG